MTYRSLILPVGIVIATAMSTSFVGAQDSARTGNQPAILDPFEHSAYFRMGVYHRNTSTALGDQAVTALPMTIGAETLAMPHLQVRARFGIAGLLVKTDSSLTGEDRDRAFHPGNLALGGFYTFGNAGDFADEAEWTLGAGGQLVLPTSQNPESDQALAHAYARAVHGVEDAWLFRPETFTVVPGVYGRWAYGPIFANLNFDVGFAVPTDDTDRSHTMQIRGEAGWRVEEDLRLGVGYTEVIAFGPDTGGDRAQGALRVFFRADLKILTFGTELVMNLDDPYGFAFDDDGIWGVVTTVGLSL